MLPLRSPRPWLAAAAFVAVAYLAAPAPTGAADPAPAPRISAADLDQLVIDEIKSRSEQMKNLQYLSDVIGARLTGSKALETANNWTADKMKEYGLENVRLEPWEIPVGWARGKASMKVVEPATGLNLLVASSAWTPGTNGKVTGDVVIVKARTKADLEKYKGKLKNAVILTSPPPTIAPITDLSYGAGGGGPRPKAKDKAEPKKDEKGEGAKTEEPKKDPPPLAGSYVADEFLQPGGFGLGRDLDEFLKTEGAACVCSCSSKPHGLITTGGGWPADRAAAEARMPRLTLAIEHYGLLYRLASRENATTKVEVEIENTFIPGPITVYNTVGEVRGSEKPDEYVVVGAHLDSWDLGSGTTDNGTGSTVVLEAARTIAALAAQGHRPKRTVRFVLFTGEEQGLHGSRQYVQRHKADLGRHSAALVHDTGTGKVIHLGMQGRKGCLEILDKELVTLKTLDTWQGPSIRSTGGTDHLPFNSAGVPGFACIQDMDEYRLTHHTQTDTFDKAKEPNLIQGAQVMAVTALRIANLPELLPRK